MTTFNTRKHSPKLVYNFTGYQRNDGDGKCQGSGVIPEPTDEQLCSWYSACRFLRRGPLPDVANGCAPEERLERTRTAMVHAISQLGGGAPSVAELEELPYRTLLACFLWLEGELPVLAAVGL